MKQVKQWIIGVTAGAVLASGSAFAAGGEVTLEKANVNIHDKASLQRGAKYFMNYCSGCHSLKFMRYSRLAEDLGLSEEEVTENLMFTGDKIGGHIVNAMPDEQAEAWLGKVPPDLSLTARARGMGDTGEDWIFSFLNGFYLDESASTGWNNTVLENASMPHVLWQMQGIQVKPEEATHGEGDSEDAEGEAAASDEQGGHGHHHVNSGLELAKEGTMSPEEYREMTRDISAFLKYAAEPAALKRASLGPWVILYLAFFALIAYFLKEEYWRDVK